MAQITQVSIRLIRPPKDRLVAFASLVLDGEFIVKGIRLFHGTTDNPDRYHAGFPQTYKKGMEVCAKCRLSLQREERDRLNDVAHPLTLQTRLKYEEAIVRAYEEALTKQQTATQEYPYFGGYMPVSLTCCTATC